MSKQYYIVLKDPTRFVPCSKEEYISYYTPVWAFMRKMKRKKECFMPVKYKCLCNVDCTTCRFSNIRYVDSIRENIEVNTVDQISLKLDVHAVISSLKESDRLLCMGILKGMSNSELMEYLNFNGSYDNFVYYKKERLKYLKKAFSKIYRAYYGG